LPAAGAVYIRAIAATDSSPVKKSAREIEIDEVLPAGEVRRSTPVPGAQDIRDPLIALIARLMDTAFKVPGTKIRFGLDPDHRPHSGPGRYRRRARFCIDDPAEFAAWSAEDRHGSNGRERPCEFLCRLSAGCRRSLLGLLQVEQEELRAAPAPRGHSPQIHDGDWFFVVALLGGMLLIVALIVIGAITLLTKLFSSGA
jgi:hypothetical protein